MENTIVISDRLFFAASAFFRVDNTEWVNNHELVYEDDDEEIINRFSSKTGRAVQIIIDFLITLLSRIAYYFRYFFYKHEQNSMDDLSVSKIVVKQFNDISNSIKNYNGFYSRGKQGSQPQTPDDENFWSKIRQFFLGLTQRKETDIQADVYRSGRMYRGNSLD